MALAHSHTTLISFILISLLFVSSMAQSPAPAPTTARPPSPSKTPPVAAPSPVTTTSPPPSISSPAPATSPSSISQPPSQAPAPAENAAIFNRFAVSGSLALGLLAAVLLM